MKNKPNSLLTLCMAALTDERLSQLDSRPIKPVPKYKNNTKKCKSCEHYKYGSCMKDVIPTYKITPLHEACEKHYKKRKK